MKVQEVGRMSNSSGLKTKLQNLQQRPFLQMMRRKIKSWTCVLVYLIVASVNSQKPGQIHFDVQITLNVAVVKADEGISRCWHLCLFH